MPRRKIAESIDAMLLSEERALAIDIETGDGNMTITDEQGGMAQLPLAPRLRLDDGDDTPMTESDAAAADLIRQSALPATPIKRLLTPEERAIVLASPRAMNLLAMLDKNIDDITVSQSQADLLTGVIEPILRTGKGSKKAVLDTVARIITPEEEEDDVEEAPAKDPWRPAKVAGKARSSRAKPTPAKKREEIRLLSKKAAAEAKTKKAVTKKDNEKPSPTFVHALKIGIIKCDPAIIELLKEKRTTPAHKTEVILGYLQSKSLRTLFKKCFRDDIFLRKQIEGDYTLNHSASEGYQSNLYTNSGRSGQWKQELTEKFNDYSCGWDYHRVVKFDALYAAYYNSSWVYYALNCTTGKGTEWHQDACEFAQTQAELELEYLLRHGLAYLLRDRHDRVYVVTLDEGYLISVSSQIFPFTMSNEAIKKMNLLGIEKNCIRQGSLQRYYIPIEETRRRPLKVTFFEEKTCIELGGLPLYFSKNNRLHTDYATGIPEEVLDHVTAYYGIKVRNQLNRDKTNKLPDLITKVPVRGYVATPLADAKAYWTTKKDLPPTTQHLRQNANALIYNAGLEAVSPALFINPQEELYGPLMRKMLARLAQFDLPDPPPTEAELDPDKPQKKLKRKSNASTDPDGYIYRFTDEPAPPKKPRVSNEDDDELEELELFDFEEEDEDDEDLTPRGRRRRQQETLGDEFIDPQELTFKKLQQRFKDRLPSSALNTMLEWPEMISVFEAVADVYEEEHRVLVLSQVAIEGVDFAPKQMKYWEEKQHDPNFPWGVTIVPTAGETTLRSVINPSAKVSSYGVTLHWPKNVPISQALLVVVSESAAWRKAVVGQATEAMLVRAAAMFTQHRLTKMASSMVEDINKVNALQKQLEEAHLRLNNTMHFLNTVGPSTMNTFKDTILDLNNNPEVGEVRITQQGLVVTTKDIWCRDINSGGFGKQVDRRYLGVYEIEIIMTDGNMKIECRNIEAPGSQDKSYHPHSMCMGTFKDILTRCKVTGDINGLVNCVVAMLSTYNAKESGRKSNFLALPEKKPAKTYPQNRTINL